MDNGEQHYREYMPPPIAEAHAGSPDKYKFSPEELTVLKDCNRESFYQRSLPFGTVLGFGTFAAVQQGYLRPNPRLGAFPKVTLAVIIGYFVGKLSYQQQCAEKLMALPGSYIGQLLRERKDGKMTAYTPTQQPNMPMFGATSSDIYSDAGPGNSLNLDMDRPLFDNNDISPGSEAAPDPPPPSNSTSTYEDLRKNNRNAYLDGRKDPYRVEQPPIAPPVRPPTTGPAPRTNKYGDAMD